MFIVRDNKRIELSEKERRKAFFEVRHESDVQTTQNHFSGTCEWYRCPSGVEMDDFIDVVARLYRDFLDDGDNPDFAMEAAIDQTIQDYTMPYTDEL